MEMIYFSLVPPNSLVSVSDYLSCPFKGPQLFLCVASGTKVRWVSTLSHQVGWASRGGT